MREGGTSTAWRRLRGECFRVYGSACVQCGDKATEVDHIIELDRGGEDTIDNLQPLCTQCHKVKTAKYNSERMKKKKPESNGFFYNALTPQTQSSFYLSPRLTESPPIAQRSPERAN